ncbi:MAG TPA: DNRLRE domain-containing protein, partial [Candidatus Dormibacteraeota bacterium]
MAALLALPMSAQPLVPASAAASTASSSSTSSAAQNSSAPPPHPTQTDASSQTDASGLPRLQLHDKHFDPARSKEVPTLDTRARQYDNPDQTHSLRLGVSPLVGFDASGRRGDLDLSLVSGEDGLLRPRRTPTPVAIAPISGRVMASVDLAAGRTLRLVPDGVRPGVVPARVPDRAGETVRYDGVLPNGTSLVLRPLSVGVESSYVITLPAAGEGLTESVELPAGYSARQANGSIELRDEKGAVAGRWQGGSATDSNPQEPGAPVAVRIQRVQGAHVTARVVVDSKWLHDPKRVFPVTIDPGQVRESSAWAGGGASYVVDTETAPTSHWNGSELWIGNDGAGHVTRTLIKFPIDLIPAHARIIGATLQVDEMWSSSCTPSPMETHTIGATWDANVYWGIQPGFDASALSTISVAAGWSPQCLEVWQSMDVSSALANWYNGVIQNNGVLLKASDETNDSGFKKFRGAGTAQAPVLDITYETYGTNPIAIDDTDTQPPATVGPGFQGMTLTNQGTETWPANGNYYVSYHLMKADGTPIRGGPMTSLPQTVSPGGKITLEAQIESLPMADYILGWDMIEMLNGQPYWFSSFGGVAPVNRSYHSDQPPTQAVLGSPANGLSLISVTPTLTASSTDPDGPRLQYRFWICDQPSLQPPANCVDSNWIDASSWTVPRGRLAWGTTYYWSAYVTDNAPGPHGGLSKYATIGPPPPFSYTPKLPVTQPEWSFGYDPYVSYQGGVNTALGNYVYSTTDLSIPTVGPPLQLTRAYNSMDRDTGLGLKPPSQGGGTYGFGRWFGVGWSSTYETKMTFDQAGNAQVDYPDGRREFLISNGDGSYQPAFGFVSNVTQVVVLEGGVSRLLFYKLTHRNRSVWQFTPDGRLDSVTDPYGRKVQLTWNNPANDCCTSVVITDQTSGRTLTVNFSAPGDKNGRVTSIVTSPVTVNGLSQQLAWKYTYDANNQLATACDPAGACTTYTNAGPGNLLTGIKRQAGNSPVSVTYDGTAAIPPPVTTIKDGLGNPTSYSYQSTPVAGAPSGSTKTTVATDALGRRILSSYNSMNQLLQRVNEDGTSKTYTFDQTGFLNSVVDENQNKITYANDGASNVLQTVDGAGGITYREYDASNHLTVVRDARSSGPTDNTYATTYTYDSAGNRTSEKRPAGTPTTWTYSFGNEPAIGGGVTPANLPLGATDPMGHATTLAYDAQGNLRKRVDPSGLVTELGYDELGREISRQQTSDSFPGGLVRTTAYDLAGRTSAVTDPAVTNTVTGAVHQRVATAAYDGNGNVTSTTISDAVGGDAARTTGYAYDANDRQVSVTDALKGVTATAYDSLGNVAQTTDALGRVTQVSYTARSWPAQVKLLGFVDSGGTKRDLTVASYTYDGAGRKATATDALGRVTRYDYDAADRLVRTTLLGYHNLDGSTRDVVLESRAYDRIGNVTSLTAGGLRTTTSTYDAAGRLVSSAVAVASGVTRTTTYAYDANGNVVSRSLTDGTRTETVSNHYDLDQSARLDRVTVPNGSAGSVITSHTYDQRNLPVSTVDPRGNVPGATAAAYTTTYSYDQAGRLSDAVGPAVQVESGGSVATSLQPAEATGYDTFGDPTLTRDAAGNVTTSTYDVLGRRTGTRYPTYVTPGGVTVNAGESWTFDAAGNVVKSTDRRGQSTTYAYDMRNLPVAQTDQLVSGQPAAGVTTVSYDDMGNVTGLKDQVGAQQSFSHDDRNRIRTAKRLVTLPGSPPSAAVYTTTYDYDDMGNRTYQSTPLGEVTKSQYNAAGELTQVTDPRLNVWQTVRDVAGRPTQVTDPLSRSIVLTYDLAGRKTLESRTDPTGKTLGTRSWQYDAAGNQLAATDGNGHTTSYGYDALSRLTSMTEPVSSTSSVVTGFGYDAAGNPTRVTDGNGNATVMSYNAWNQLATRVLPSTLANPALGDRQWTWTYDAGGLPVTEAQPGLTIDRTYDELGRLVRAAGGSTTSTYAYDLAGRRTSAGGTAGSVTFNYDERGLQTSASGAAGSSSFTYDGDGQLVSRSDASGKTTFGYDAAGHLTSISEPLTGVQQGLGYDGAGQLASRTYGAGAATRTYAYDGLGQLTSDVMKNPAGTVVQQAGYTYDGDGNLLQRQLTTASGTGSDTYAYDQANRLTSWTNPASTVTGYAWDGAGNRVQAGSQAYTFDERNRLVSGNGVTYTWSANGNLLSASDSSQITSYGYDGLNRLTSAQQALQPPLNGTSTTTYGYDGLDRMVQRNGVAFSYAGEGQQPVTDGSFTYSQDPAGEVLAVRNASPALLAAEDRHGDLALTMDTAGNAKGSFSYDPFGAAIPRVSPGGAPTPPNVGFQGQWTDPTTGAVLMGARWYDGKSGRFLTRDTFQPPVLGAVDANTYLYGRANPLGYTDFSGHWGGRWTDWWTFAAPVALRVAAAVVGAVGATVALGVGIGLVAGFWPHDVYSPGGCNCGTSGDPWNTPAGTDVAPGGAVDPGSWAGPSYGEGGGTSYYRRGGRPYVGSRPAYRPRQAYQPPPTGQRTLPPPPFQVNLGGGQVYLRPDMKP